MPRESGNRFIRQVGIYFMGSSAWQLTGAEILYWLPFVNNQVADKPSFYYFGLAPGQ